MPNKLKVLKILKAEADYLEAALKEIERRRHDQKTKERV